MDPRLHGPLGHQPPCPLKNQSLLWCEQDTLMFVHHMEETQVHPEVKDKSEVKEISDLALNSRN